MYSDATVEYAGRIIGHRVRKLLGRAGLTKGDREDLEQQLMCDVLRRLRRFDPSRGAIGTFIARIVERHIAIILRDRRAPIRDYRRNGCSLNDDLTGEDGETVERADAIDAQVNRPGRSEEDRSQLILDVHQVVDGLPEDLRTLCVRLKAQTVTEISLQTGTPRTTLYDAIRRIRGHFEAAGMDGYL